MNDMEALWAEMKADPYDGRFASKLQHEDRCAILAARRRGVSTNVLAAAFEIDRRTVTKICSPLDKKYPNVQKEYHNLGETAFCDKYLTPEVTQRIHAAFKDENVKKTTTQLRADQAAKLSAEARRNGPQPTAVKREGYQNIALDQLDGQLFAWTIEYRKEGEHPDGEGWYGFWGKDMTGSVCGPFNTSELCYQNIKAEQVSWEV